MLSWGEIKIIFSYFFLKSGLLRAQINLSLVSLSLWLFFMASFRGCRWWICSRSQFFFYLQLLASLDFIRLANVTWVWANFKRGQSASSRSHKVCFDQPGRVENFLFPSSFEENAKFFVGLERCKLFRNVFRWDSIWKKTDGSAGDLLAPMKSLKASSHADWARDFWASSFLYYRFERCNQALEFCSLRSGLPF